MLRLTLALGLVATGAFAAGHGTFYDCAADGMPAFTMEVAASDCMVDGTKGTLASENPMVCDVAGDNAATITMANDLSFTWQAVGSDQVFEGTCTKR